MKAEKLNSPMFRAFENSEIPLTEVRGGLGNVYTYNRPGNYRDCAEQTMNQGCPDVKNTERTGWGTDTP